jgi:hypothetical protein
VVDARVVLAVVVLGVIAVLVVAAGGGLGGGGVYVLPPPPPPYPVPLDGGVQVPVGVIVTVAAPVAVISSVPFDVLQVNEAETLGSEETESVC